MDIVKLTVTVSHSNKDNEIVNTIEALLIDDRALFMNILLHPLVHYFNTLKPLKHLKHSYMF